jgi:hypothetical protein
MDGALKNALDELKFIEAPMPKNPFVAEAAPVRIEAPLRALPGWEPGWKATPETPPDDLKTMPHNPADLPAEDEMLSAGPVQTLTLLPYGSTHLRLTTLPLIQ